VKEGQERQREGREKVTHRGRGGQATGFYLGLEEQLEDNTQQYTHTHSLKFILSITQGAHDTCLLCYGYEFVLYAFPCMLKDWFWSN